MERTALTAAQRTLRARIAAYALHAQGGTSTKSGTSAFLARFDAQVDPDSTLTPEERARRAEHARKAYMATLALRSSRARSKEKAPTEVEPVEAQEVGRASDDSRSRG